MPESMFDLWAEYDGHAYGFVPGREEIRDRIDIAAREWGFDWLRQIAEADGGIEVLARLLAQYESDRALFERASQIPAHVSGDPDMGYAARRALAAMIVAASEEL